jgi:hypothetical protein
MTEQEELDLKTLVDSGSIIMWNPDQVTARTIVRVGTWRSNDPDVEDEPGLCAFFDNGEYVALYNCELEEFIKAQRLK